MCFCGYPSQLRLIYSGEEQGPQSHRKMMETMQKNTPQNYPVYPVVNIARVCLYEM